MRLSRTIIVLVLLAIVGAYAYFIESKPPVEETQKLFAKLSPDDIIKVHLQYPDSEIQLERGSDQKWVITKPIATDADQTTANNLVRAIADCEMKKVVEEKPADLEPFGLKKPDVVVTVTTKSKGVLPSIDVGKTTPVGFSTYIRTADKPAVMLTSSAFSPGMKKKVNDLRDRELMSFKVDDVNRVTIEREGSEIDLVRNGDKWNIVKPAKYPADPAQVRQLLSALTNTRVADFIADTPASVTQYGLEKPHLTVAVFTGKENSRQSVLFGFKQPEQGKDGIYVRRGERAPVYTVHPYVMTDADKSINDLRDKTVLAFAPSDVGSIKVTGGANFTLQRAAGGRWQLDSGAGTKTDADSIEAERLLENLRDLKGMKIAEDPISDPKKFALDKPDETIALAGKDGKPIGAVMLAKVESKPEAGALAASTTPDYYATSSVGKIAYEIEGFNFTQLTKGVNDYKLKSAPAASPSPRPKS